MTEETDKAFLERMQRPRFGHSRPTKQDIARLLDGYASMVKAREITDAPSLNPRNTTMSEISDEVVDKLTQVIADINDCNFYGDNPVLDCEHCDKPADSGSYAGCRVLARSMAVYFASILAKKDAEIAAAYKRADDLALQLQFMNTVADDQNTQLAAMREAPEMIEAEGVTITIDRVFNDEDVLVDRRVLTVHPLAKIARAAIAEEKLK
jgi:hypothetical protein